MDTNKNPREALAGWSLHNTAGWILLALAMGVSAAAWLPEDWRLARWALQCIGCFAGGLIIAGKGAIWQRIDSAADSGLASTPAAPSVRASITGWRYHPKAARILLGILLVGVGGIAWVPKDWAVLRAAMQVVGMFAAGMLAARDAAIWQRTEHPRQIGTK